MSEGAADAAGVPALRFPEFVAPWTRAPLSDHLIVKGARNDQRRLGRASVLSVSGDVGVVNQIAHMGRSYAGEDLVLYHVVDPGDLVYTKSPLKQNPYGIIKANRGEPGIVSTLYAVYVPTNGANPWFMERYFEDDNRLNRYLKPLVNKGAKNDMKVSNAQVLTGDVIFPSPPEQAKIAAFIDITDRRAGLLRRRLNLLNLYKTSVLQGLFSRRLRFTEEAGSPFPEWTSHKLGDLFGWVRSNTLSRDALTYEPGSIQTLHYGDIHSRYRSRFRQAEAGAPFVRSGLLTALEAADFCQPGDVVIADASEDHADIGKAIEILEVEPQSLTGGLHTHVARPLGDQLALGFSGYLFQSDALRRQIMRAAQGVSVLSISRGHLERMTVDLPSTEEQRRIAAFLNVLDNKIEAVESQADAMVRFRKALLQQMFV